MSTRKKPILIRQCRLIWQCSYYSAQYNCRWEKSGIFPSDLGIFPMGTGIKLDLCFCIIPTVGLYGKLGEVIFYP